MRRAVAIRFVKTQSRMLKAWLFNVFVCSLLLVVASPSMAAAKLPNLVAQDLNEQSYQLPADLPAEKTLLLIAYKREQQANINTWIDGLQLKTSNLPWLELPVLEDYGSWFQWFVDNGMRRGIKGDYNRAKVVTVYTEKDAFNTSMAIPNEESIYACVVTRQGEVLHIEAGDYSKEASDRLIQFLN